MAKGKRSTVNAVGNSRAKRVRSSSSRPVSDSSSSSSPSTVNKDPQPVPGSDYILRPMPTWLPPTSQSGQQILAGQEAVKRKWKVASLSSDSGLGGYRGRDCHDMALKLNASGAVSPTFVPQLEAMRMSIMGLSFNNAMPSCQVLYRLLSLFPHILKRDDYVDFFKLNWHMSLKHNASGRLLSMHEWKGGFSNPLRSMAPNESEFKRDAVELLTLLFSADFIECHPPSKVVADTQQMPPTAFLSRSTFVVDCHLLMERVDEPDQHSLARRMCEEPSPSCFDWPLVPQQLWFRTDNCTWQPESALHALTSAIVQSTTLAADTVGLTLGYLCDPVPARLVISSALMMYRAISLFELGFPVEPHADGVWRCSVLIGGVLLVLEDRGGWFTPSVRAPAGTQPDAALRKCLPLLDHLCRKDFTIGYDGVVAGSVA